MRGAKGEMLLAHLLQEWHAQGWRWEDVVQWEEGITACVDAVVSMFEYAHIYHLGTAWISAGAFDWELVTEPSDEMSRVLYEVGAAFATAIRPDHIEIDEDESPVEMIDRIVLDRVWN